MVDAANSRMRPPIGPIAAVALPATVSAGQNVTLNASGSAAACGRTVAAVFLDRGVTRRSIRPPSWVRTRRLPPSSPRPRDDHAAVTVTDDQGRVDTADVDRRAEPRHQRGAGIRRHRRLRDRRDFRTHAGGSHVPPPPPTPDSSRIGGGGGGGGRRIDRLSSCSLLLGLLWRRRARRQSCTIPVAIDRHRAIFAPYAIDGSGSPLQLQLKALRQVCGADQGTGAAQSRDNETAHVACLRSARISHASASRAPAPSRNV